MRSRQPGEVGLQVNSPPAPQPPTMDHTRAFRCSRCGLGRVSPQKKEGRICAYRVFSTLVVPSDVELLTCDRCGTVLTDEHTAADLEPVLAAAYKAQLSKLARYALADLAPDASQKKIERLLDLSQGYISRVFRGHGTPSAPLVLLLALLAHDPSLLDWVARYWADIPTTKCRLVR